jgi:hypothetical protein
MLLLYYSATIPAIELPAIILRIRLSFMRIITPSTIVDTNMRNISVAALLFVMALAFSAPGARADEGISDDAVSRLKHGGFIWEPERAPDGPMSIVVDLSAQRASVYRDGVRIGATTVSSGRKGYRTPAGVFRILQKDKSHRSKKYGNLPMPYTMRLTWDGVALHAGGVPGHPSSHGCVHLPRTFARALFNEASIGTKVVMTYAAPDRADHQPARSIATDQPDSEPIVHSIAGTETGENSGTSG